MNVIDMNSAMEVAMFVIEDLIHADHHGEFANLHEAIAELKRRAKIPWDQEPNRAPCMSWKTCGREYYVLEYDESESTCKELRRVAVLEVSASGVNWSNDFKDEV